MVAKVRSGQKTWKASVDKDGFIDYKVQYRVEAEPTDGPTNVLLAPGLPLYGSWWIVDNDINLWAWRRWDTEVEPEVEGEPNVDWVVTFTYSTRWPSPKDGDRPHDPNPPDDPRLDPPKITGSFIRYTEEATQDRFGVPITNSAYEVLRGPQVEFDRNRLQIKIEFNTAQLPLNYLMGMADTVNAVPLWGCPPRTIKMSEPSFELSFFGQGIYYWKLSLTFDIDLGTWDRNLLDEGTKVLKGHWDTTPKTGTGNWVPDNIAPGVPPDPLNPTHFQRFKDRNNEPTRVVLNGQGLPASVGIGGGQHQQKVTNAFMWINETDGNTATSPAENPGKFGWLVITGLASTKTSTWTSGVTYYPGSVVSLPGAIKGAAGVWLCLAKNNTVYPPSSQSAWYAIPNTGGEGWSPNNRGAWNADSIYTQGDIVTVAGQITVNNPIVNTGMPGIIHVEKYPGSDFSLLGIPLTLPLTY